MTADSDSEMEGQKGLVTNKPVIGVIADSNDAEAVAGAILRGQEEGYSSLVVVPENGDHEVRTFAHRLGAVVVEPQEKSLDKNASDIEQLRREARRWGFPGVLYFDQLERTIDFAASVQKFKESKEYVVRAEVAPRVNPRPTVIAAIPAYNEESSIAEVVTKTLSSVDEVLVVDDGSTDNTVDRARTAGATVISHDSNRGYGRALKTAFHEAEIARADHLIVLDGDGQHDASDIQKLIATQQETGAEVVIGSRFSKGSESVLPAYRRLGLFIINILTNLSMGVVRKKSRVADTQSGFRSYNKDAIATLANDETIGDRMDASVDILYHAHHYDYDIAEVGTTVDYDVDDANTYSPLSHGIILLSNILRTIERERPILILCFPGFVNAFIGIGFGYWTFTNYVSTTTFSIGLAMLSVFFVLLGIFMAFTGIILHSLSTYVNAPPRRDDSADTVTRHR